MKGAFYLRDNRKKEIQQTSTELVLDTFLDVGSDFGAEIAKESITSIAGDLAVDTASSFVPGVSGAIQSYKRARFEKNVKRMTEEMYARLDQINANLESKTSEQKRQIDELFQYILDGAIDEQQEEKIKYMVHGFVHITEHEFFSEDFVLTYYDVLKELRLVDISVLKLMYPSIYFEDQTSRETFQDVMERHGITYEQYQAVRSNLIRIGICTTKTDLNVADDLQEILAALKQIRSYLDKLTASKSKNLPKLKEPKLKSKDQIKISKFGRDFVEFFFDLDEPLNDNENSS